MTTIFSTKMCQAFSWAKNETAYEDPYEWICFPEVLHRVGNTVCFYRFLWDEGTLC